MSKHKKHRKSKAENPVEPSNIMDMLNNVDVNQLSSMLSGLNINSEALGSMLNNMNMGQESKNIPNQARGEEGDKILSLLNAIRPIIAPDKVHLIEKFMYIYNIQKVLNNK